MRLVRYFFVQAGAYVLDLGGFEILHGAFGVDPLLANAAGKVVAGLFAFVAHRFFTFPLSKTAGAGPQALRYFSFLALNIPVSSALLEGALLVVHVAVVAKLLADGTYFFASYWLSKRFIFRAHSKVLASRSERGSP